MRFPSPLLRWLTPLFALALAACQPPADNATKNVKLNPDVPDQKVESDNYLTGRKFCEVYSKITSQEHGKRIDVPRGYDGTESGKWSLYTWTPRPFDPKKPTLIYVEGGPGANSHSFGAFADATVNEIRFDQRGIGCSAPESYEDYQNPKLYSSLNTTRDIEEIRKAYGLTKVTVLGASYGTVPATMYGHFFPKSVRSIILEGVEFTEGDGTMEHRATLLNKTLEKLSPKAREGFKKFMSSEAKETSYVYSIVEALKKSDGGYEVLGKFFENVFSTDSPETTLTATILKLAEGKKTNENPYPQAPGAVDGNILTKIFCQELGLREAWDDFPVYYPAVDRYIPYDLGERAAKDCAAAGVPNMVTDLYRASKYPMNVPVYYYQGAHDGATPAAGAVKHWREAAKGTKYFMLKKRGGHGPNLLPMMDEKEPAQRLEQIFVFKKALRAEKITPDDMVRLNRNLKSADERWLLYLGDDEKPEDELGKL